MTDTLPDRWATRDFPVLRRVAELVEVDDLDELRPHNIAADLGQEPEETLRSMLALHDAGYVAGRREDTLTGKRVVVTDLTERGRRTVGVWPSGESVDALVQALQQAAEATSDPEEEGALRKTAGAVLGVGRDVMTDVMGRGDRKIDDRLGTP